MECLECLDGLGGTEGILTARAALMRDFEVGFSFENYPSGLRAPTIPDEDKVSTCVGAMDSSRFAAEVSGS